MNTHSRCADSRAELMCAHAIRAGAGLDTARRLLNTITTEEAVGILAEEGLLEKTMEQVIEKVHYYLQHRCGGVPCNRSHSLFQQSGMAWTDRRSTGNASAFPAGKQ